MPDTFDTADLSATPLTAAVVAAAKYASTVDQPVLTETATRALLDALRAVEQRIIAGGL